MGAGTAAAGDTIDAEGTGCTSADLAGSQAQEESTVPEQSSGSRLAEGMVLGDIVLGDTGPVEGTDPVGVGSASCQAAAGLGIGPAFVAAEVAGSDRKAWAPSGSPRLSLRWASRPWFRMTW
jgi:hypothetical protein